MTFFDEQPDGDIHGECAAEIAWLNERITGLEAEIIEQARLLGMSGERECALLAKIAAQSAALAKARDALALVNKYAPRALECAHFHHPKRMQHGDGDFCEPTHMYYHALNISVEALAAIDALKP